MAEPAAPIHDARSRTAAAVLVPASAVALIVAVADPPRALSAVLIVAAAAVSVVAVSRLVQGPLESRAESYRTGWVRTQRELTDERADRELRARLERALRSSETEPAALRVGLRAVAEAAPDADVALLLSLPDEPRIGWQVDLRAGELGDAEPVSGAPRCAALTEGASVLASTTSLEACAHLAGIDGEVSAACVPLRAAERTIGTVCVITAPGELLDPRVIERIEWIVERTGHRTAEHRAGQAPSLAGRPDPLTGLPGPTTLRPYLRDLVRSLSPFCLAVIEVDEFDELSSDAVADASLVTVAGVLCDTLRPDDLICRLDGSRFAAVLPQCASAQAVSVMERVREGLALQLTEDALLDDDDLDDDAYEGFTCSAGVVESHLATSLDEIVTLATSACAAARAAGGNRVAVSRDTAGHA